MTKIPYKSRTSAIVGLSASTLFFANVAIAAPRESTKEPNPMAQVNPASQFRDVFPGDWAFAALDNLIDRYDCLAGYPDGTFRGDRPLSRYEFAAGLNACLQQIERLLAETTADFVVQEDLEILKRLLQEFEGELATLATRTDNLEARTAFLEDHQFSTTTKLRGEAIFAITDVLTGDGTTVTFPSVFSRTGAININSPEQSTVFANRIRLDLLTSFTGKDELKIRLTSGNFPHPNRPDGGFRYGPDPLRGFVGGAAFSPEGQQTFNDIASLPADNTLGLTALSYEFSLGEQLRAVIMAAGGEHHDYVPTTFSSWDDDNGGTGSLSVLGQRSPIYNFSGAGLGLTYNFNDVVSLSAGYLSTYANEPSAPQPLPGNPFAGGLFAGRYSTLAQLTLKPRENFSLGLTYSHSYHPAEAPFNNLPIFFNDQGTNLANVPIIPSQEVSVDSYGIAALWQVNPKFAINGWFAYSRVNSSAGTAFIFPAGNTNYSSSNADILTYGISLAFPDLGGEGNLGGIVVGASPHTTRSQVPEPFQTGNNWFGATNLGSDFTDLIAENAIPWHLEAFYRYKVTDNIFLTPGAIWLTAPNQSARNPDVVIGTLRLTFRF
ncbi:MAG: iron uptake porin [Cyanobacteriota bacterium]|nr:iron uptake porin [Cyanobacteriota bacterium]